MYFEDNHDKESLRAVLMDLTFKGAGLFSEVALPIGAKIVLEFKLKNMDEEIVIPCSVMWSEKVPSTNRIIKVDPNFCWKFGVRFEVKSDEEKLCIQVLNDELGGQSIKKPEKKEVKKVVAPVASPDTGEDSGGGAMPVPQAA